MIILNDNQKEEIKELLADERAVLKNILRVTREADRNIQDKKLKEADEIFKKNIEEGRKIKDIEEKLKTLLRSYSMTFENLKEEFKNETDGVAEILLKISELNNKLNKILSKKKNSVLDSFRKLQIGKKVHGQYLRDLKGHNGSINILE